MKYLNQLDHPDIPVAAYAAGIFLTEWIRMRVGENGTVHWKEGILWL